jgi:hypothetical protein
MQIKLTREMYTEIDDIDSDLSGVLWHARKGFGQNFYACSKKYGHMHRIILERMLGRMLSVTEECDHIDHDGLNNKRGNLRVASRSQNTMNSRTKRGRSKLRGVYRNSQLGKITWRAQVVAGSIHIYIGAFNDKYIAACVYDAMARELFGEFARTNFR